MSAYACCSDVPFENVVRFLAAFSIAKSDLKTKQLAHFREKNVVRPSKDVYAIYRLLLPQSDRRMYQMKEQSLANALVEAAGINKASPAAQRVMHWKQDVGHKAGSNFADACDDLFKRHCAFQNDDPRAIAVTVGAVNQQLDQLSGLSEAGSGKKKTMLLRWVLSNMSPRQCKVLVKIILKDLKVGLSVERVLRDYHRDANKSFNINQDLEKVLVELADPTKRIIKDVAMPGDIIRPQLCERANSVDAVFNIISGNKPIVTTPFVVEIKIDGERMAVHMKDGKMIAMTSRKGHDHASKSNYAIMEPVMETQIIPQDAIIDGEMVVWNRRRCRFEPFGTLRPVVNAVGEGYRKGQRVVTEAYGYGNPTDNDDDAPFAEDLEIVYVAFDLVYQTGVGSITHEPLSKRQEVLRAAIRQAPVEGYHLGPPACCIRGRIAVLLPGEPLLPPCAPPGGAVSGAGAGGEECDVSAMLAEPQGGGGAGAGSQVGVPTSDPSSRALSRIGKTKDDIQQMYDLALANNEEGIVVKGLDTPYEFHERKNWVKLKPDYKENEEVECVIIGANYGDGAKAGKLNEFILALPDCPNGEGSTPVAFTSFCRVGTGLDQGQRDVLREKIKPLMVDARKAKPPACYNVTGQEKPDFWVSDPLKSAVVEVRAELRTIKSAVYAMGYTLRFPRITRVRYDRTPVDAYTVQRLERTISEFRGSLRMKREGFAPRRRQKGDKAAGKRKKTQGSLVPRHLMPVDVSGVEVTHNLLEGRRFTLQNAGAPGDPPSKREEARKEVSQLIKQLGGGVEIGAPNRQGDLYIASFLDHKPEALARFEAAGRQAFDVVNVQWLRDCKAAGRLLPIKPAHYFFLSAVTRAACAFDIGVHGNPLTRDVDADDVRQIMGHLMSTKALEASLAKDRAAAPAAAPARRGAAAANGGRGDGAGGRGGGSGGGGGGGAGAALASSMSIALGDDWMAALGYMGSEGAAGDGSAPQDATGLGLSDDVPLELMVPGIERTLREMGLGAGSPAAARSSLLLGCHVVFVRCPVSPAVGAGAGGAGAGAGGAGGGGGRARRPWETEWEGEALLAGCAELIARADACLERGLEAQLESLKTQAMLLGASLSDHFTRSTTHLVLWAPGAFGRPPRLAEFRAQPAAADAAGAGAGGLEAGAEEGAGSVWVDAVDLVKALASCCPKEANGASRGAGVGEFAVPAPVARKAAPPRAVNRRLRVAAPKGSAAAQPPGASQLQGSQAELSGPAAPHAAAIGVAGSQPLAPSQAAGAAARAGLEAAAAADAALPCPKQLARARRRLAGGRLRLVTAQWLVDAAADADEPAAAAAGLRLRDEGGYAPLIQGPDGGGAEGAERGGGAEVGEVRGREPFGLAVARWPWAEVGLEPMAGGGAARDSSSASEGEFEGAAGSGDGAGAAGGSDGGGRAPKTRRRAPAAPRPRAPRRAAAKVKDEPGEGAGAAAAPAGPPGFETADADLAATAAAVARTIQDEPRPGGASPPPKPTRGRKAAGAVKDKPCAGRASPPPKPAHGRKAAAVAAPRGRGGGGGARGGGAGSSGDEGILGIWEAAGDLDADLNPLARTPGSGAKRKRGATGGAKKRARGAAADFIDLLACDSGDEGGGGPGSAEALAAAAPPTAKVKVEAGAQGQGAGSAPAALPAQAPQAATAPAAAAAGGGGAAPPEPAAAARRRLGLMARFQAHLEGTDGAPAAGQSRSGAGASDDALSAAAALPLPGAGGSASLALPVQEPPALGTAAGAPVPTQHKALHADPPTVHTSEPLRSFSPSLGLAAPPAPPLAQPPASAQPPTPPAAGPSQPQPPSDAPQAPRQHHNPQDGGLPPQQAPAAAPPLKKRRLADIAAVQLRKR